MKKTLHIVFLSFFLVSQSSETFASFGKKSTEKEKEVSANPNVVVDPSKTVTSALDEFKNLSKKERKDRIKEAKKELQNFKEAKKAGAAAETNTILLAILAILLPPLAVFLHQGEINAKFWISLLLTLLFFLPGIIYALLVIFGNA